MSQSGITDYEASKPLVDGVVEGLRDQIVGDAPADADEVLAQIPVLPGWLRVSVIVGSTVGLWALLIWGARALLAG